MTNQKIDTVLFDLDGTICRYKRSPDQLLDIAFEKVGEEKFFDEEEYIERIGKLADESENMVDLRERCFVDIAKEKGRSRGLALSVAEAFEEERDHSRVEFMEGARETLELLSSDGYRLGLVTNGHPNMQKPKIESLEVSDDFDAKVFAGHDTEWKPHPEPFETALESLGSEASRSIFVGDSVEGDVGGARNVGMKSAWVSIGFEFETPESYEATPDYVLEESVYELVEVL